MSQNVLVDLAPAEIIRLREALEMAEALLEKHSLRGTVVDETSMKWQTAGDIISNALGRD